MLVGAAVAVGVAHALDSNCNLGSVSGTAHYLGRPNCVTRHSPLFESAQLCDTESLY